VTPLVGLAPFVALARGRLDLAAALFLVSLGFLGLDVIFAAIWEGLKWIAEKAAIIAAAVWQAFQKAAHYTWTGLQWLGGKAKDGLQWLKDRASGFATWWKEKAAPWLVRAFDKVDMWFKAHFGWLFTWVHRIQSILGWVYKNVLRPLFQFLEVSRLALRLLASLGVKWAGKLDAVLGRIEQKLFSLFYSLVSFVNGIASILDLIFNPWGALRRSLFLWSAWAYVGELSALLRIAHIDHDPWPEALQLAAGPDPADLRQKGNELEHSLSAPPGWALEARQEMEELLIVHG
jgi:hypothetical protein